jgi:hypothetical protein
MAHSRNLQPRALSLICTHNYVTLSVSKRTISQDGTSAAKHTKALVKPYEANKSPR